MGLLLSYQVLFFVKVFDLTYHLETLTTKMNLQLNLHMSYGKDISGNAVSKVLQIFQEEARITNEPAK